MSSFAILIIGHSFKKNYGIKLTTDSKRNNYIESDTNFGIRTVQVKFTGLVMKTFNVTAISAVNVPDGMQVNVITKALSVTIRGPEAMIGAMKETDLTVEVDLAGAQVGTANMTAKVIVPNTFSDAGAVGTYQVSVKLSEK